MSFDATSLDFAHAQRIPASRAETRLVAGSEDPADERPRPLGFMARELHLAHAASLELARARPVRGARARVSCYATRALQAGTHSLERARREFRFSRYQCSTMLQPGEYDIVLVEAPRVPRAELRSALRWKVKDMVDYAMDAATIDFLEIPQDDAAAEGRQLYAIVARSEIVQARVRQFEQAGIRLRVIEIPETAQRNVAALYEEDERGVALVHFGRDGGLLTISRCGELYGARRLEVGLNQLAADSEDGEAHERVALEIQRTFDHFERQFRSIAVGQLLLAPQGTRTRLFPLLQERLAIPVRQIDLAEVLAFHAAAPDEATQWRLFHHFGAALRDGPE